MGMRRCVAIVWIALMGCGSSPGAGADAALAPTLDAGLGPIVRCDDLPARPTSHRVVDYVPAAEDFTFDRRGNLLSVAIGSGGLMRTPFGGPATLAVPGISGFARGIRPLPSGELIIADPETGSLRKVTAGGSVSTLVGGLPGPNGVVIGRDGLVYVSHDDGGQLRRIDPTTGTGDVLVNTPARTYNGLVFSLDYDTLYVTEESGTIYAYDMATGELSPFVSLQVDELLDGMTLDECGNVYVIDISAVVWRIDPAGNAEEYYRIDDDLVLTPALNFGSGAGDWRRDRLYLMHFNGGVFELDTGGLRGRHEPHLE